MKSMQFRIPNTSEDATKGRGHSKPRIFHGTSCLESTYGVEALATGILNNAHFHCTCFCSTCYRILT